MPDDNGRFLCTWRPLSREKPNHFLRATEMAKSPTLNVFPAVTPGQRLVSCSALLSQRMWGCSLVLLLYTCMYGVLLIANILPGVTFLAKRKASTFLSGVCSHTLAAAEGRSTRDDGIIAADNNTVTQGDSSLPHLWECLAHRTGQALSSEPLAFYVHGSPSLKLLASCPAPWRTVTS